MELIKSLKNNSLIIILISVLFFFCFYSSVNAQTFIDINDNEVIITDVPSSYQNYPYFISVYYNQYSLWVATDPSAYYYIDNNNNTDFICCTSTVNVYRLNGSNWEQVYSTGTLGVNSSFTCKSIDFYCGGYPVYNDTNKSSTFYSPLVVTLEGIQEVGEVPKQMAKVLKILIPIGLIACGIFSTILLVRSVLWRLS